MIILSKANYRFNVTPIKIPILYFTEIENHPKTHIEPQKTPCKKTILKNKLSKNLHFQILISITEPW